MVRKLAMAVSLAVGTLPLSVYALGLGEIKTTSALNEKFEAEIELLSVKKGELDTLRAGLAPAEIFAQTGVERPFLLSQLKFKPMRTRDGRAVIRVTSDTPIREPFLDFFVQVAWPKGQLVREYTVLLDPPVVTRRAAPRVTAPASSAAPRAPEQRQRPSPVLSRAAAVPPGGEYGPVQSNETLWQIADALRPAGISVHQMMIALYRANPDAFLNGDINLLKKGQVLQVPEENEIRGIGRSEAVAEFGRLSEGWIAPATTGQVAEAEESKETEQEIATDAVEPGVAGEAAAEPEEARLKIAGAEERVTSEPGAGEQAGPAEAGAEELRQKLLLVEEQAETARQEAANLRGRVDLLESQLEDMKRLLKLRDEELAQLQAQIATGGEEAGASALEEAQLPSDQEGGVPEEEIQAPAAEQEVAETTGVPPDEAVDEPLVEETAEEVVVEGMAPEEAEVAALLESAGEQAPVATEETATEAETPEVVEEPQPVESMAEQPEAVAPGWKQWVTDNWQLVAGGGGVLLLGLLGLAMSRRRREEQEQQIPPSANAPRPAPRETESILKEEEAAALQTAADSAIGDTSFLSEYSTEELRALHEDTVEVDPVSEADVYIAYGRYSQAEEILRQAEKNGDDSAALRHKMLEVYYATQKKDEFRKLAEEMKAAGQDKEDPKAWEHIQTMGRDLDRNNPLFAAAAVAASTVPETGGADSDMSLDLSTLAEEVDSALNPESEPVEGLSNMDLELPSLQIEPDTSQVAEKKSAEEKTEDLDLELNETELQTELADINDLGELGIESNMLDDTLADLTGDLEGVMADSQVLDEPLELEENALSALDDLTTAMSADELGGEEAPTEATAGVDSRIGDEVETKLELARAFLEIGDADGARSILHEVQEDGTPQQKEAATEMLSQLEG